LKQTKHIPANLFLILTPYDATSIVSVRKFIPEDQMLYTGAALAIVANEYSTLFSKDIEKN